MTEHRIFKNGESIKIVDGVVVEIHTMRIDDGFLSKADYQYRGDVLISVKAETIRLETAK